MLYCSNDRRCFIWGAEGVRDELEVLSLETLRQKDYREMNAWRGCLCQVTEGASPLKCGGHSLR